MKMEEVVNKLEALIGRADEEAEPLRRGYA